MPRKGTWPTKEWTDVVGGRVQKRTQEVNFGMRLQICGWQQGSCWSQQIRHIKPAWSKWIHFVPVSISRRSTITEAGKNQILQTHGTSSLTWMHSVQSYIVQRVNAHTLRKLRTTHIDATARRSCMHPQALHELEGTDNDKQEQLTTQNETHACHTHDRTRLHVAHHTWQLHEKVPYQRKKRGYQT